MQLTALQTQDRHESAFSSFLVASQHSHTAAHQVYWITMQLTALQTQDRHESAFSSF